MPSALLRAVRDALDAPGAPGPGAHVLVAVSGGPDSTALVSALAALALDRGLVVSVGHVDHGLRGPESRADAEAVRALASRLHLACTVVTAVVPPGPNLEARARDVRHRALGRLARDVGASHIAFAHTADDQVETVLLRLLRGAGRHGLGGMSARRGRIWRPLLAATRADVRRHLAEADLPFRVDRTNADLRHTRNRLRRLVLPLLEREFNPRLRAAIPALAERLRDEDAYLAAQAADHGAAHRRGRALAATVADEPPAIGRRIVRAWLDAAGAGAATARDVERVLMLARGVRGTVAVRGPARIVREGDLLERRAGRRAAVAATLRREIGFGCVLDGPKGTWRLSVSPSRSCGRDELDGLTVWRARFDAEALALPLVVRSVEPGDRIDVPGVGTRKLQDVFVDAKVPRERRGGVPVVLDATGRILWVPGVVRGGAARVTSVTARVVDMELRGEQ